MAKTKTSDAPAKAVKADGSIDRPFPWVAPFPASVISEDDGKTETVFVKCTVHQMLGINGTYIQPGQQVIPCNFAHAHSHAIGAPKE